MFVVSGTAWCLYHKTCFWHSFKHTTAGTSQKASIYRWTTTSAQLSAKQGPKFWTDSAWDSLQAAALLTFIGSFGPAQLRTTAKSTHDIHALATKVMFYRAELLRHLSSQLWKVSRNCLTLTSLLLWDDSSVECALLSFRCWLANILQLLSQFWNNITHSLHCLCIGFL